MNTEVKTGQRYRHFKGKEYVVIALGRDSETTEEVVIYQAQYDSPKFGMNSIWVRPLAEFCGQKEIDNKLFDRFTLITD